MTVKEIFETMDYGPAPESAAEALAWLADQRRPFGHFIDGALHRAGRGCSTAATPRPATVLAQRDAGDAGRCGRGRRRRAQGAAQMGEARRARAGARTSMPWRGCCRNTRACSPCWKRSTTASRSARAATSTCRWRSGISTITPGMAQLMESELPGPRAAGRLRPDHPVELPAADAGVEDRARAGHGQHRGAETGRIHLADRAAVRRNLPRRPGCRKGVVNIVTGDGAVGEMIVGRRGRQDRLHRLDRGGPQHPRGDGRHAARR